MSSGRTISSGYILPAQKQGTSDQRFFHQPDLNPVANRTQASWRYEATYNLVAPSVRIYNAFWSAFEASSQLPSDTNAKRCPSSYVQVWRSHLLSEQAGFAAARHSVSYTSAPLPAWLVHASAKDQWFAALANLSSNRPARSLVTISRASKVANLAAKIRCYKQVPATLPELQAKGYHKFHCYSRGSTATLQAFLDLDAEWGIESAVILWGSECCYSGPIAALNSCVTSRFPPCGA